MKTGIVDVGGGMRDIYGAGVLDCCLAHGISFDLGIGVSAGSANLSSFFAGQKGRNYQFYIEYAFRKAYISAGNWLKTRNYVNLDYGYGTLSNSDGEYPLDFPAILSNPAEFQIVATNAVTGRPRYFDKTEMKQDDYGAVKASSCVPVANTAYLIDGIPYFDGGLSDPIPVQRALDLGCDRVVLILTRPKDFRRDPEKDRFAARVLRRKYPNAARVMSERAHTYNTELDAAMALEQQGKVLIVAPDEIEGMKTLTRDKEVMNRLYQKGIRDAHRIEAFLSDELQA
ncbi:MAG: patatin family protein [Parasporobacterium sp.]|nr:patatin family protein [Parasporobacterium sp.]